MKKTKPLETILLMSPFAFPFVSGSTKAAKRCIAFFERLSEFTSPKVIAPKRSNYLHMRLYEVLQEQFPESVLFLSVDPNNKEETAYYWPRDLFQLYNKTLVVPNHAKNSVPLREILSLLEVPYSQRIISSFGEGGFVLRSDNTLICSEAIYEDFKPDGFSVYSLPVTMTEDKKLASRLKKCRHIDLEVAILKNSNKELMLCVNEFYYSAFFYEIDLLAKFLNADIFLVPEHREQARRAVNIITLPNNAAVIPTYCPKTKEFLQEFLGKDRVISVGLHYFYKYSLLGGLRCRTNLIELP